MAPRTIAVITGCLLAVLVPASVTAQRVTRRIFVSATSGAGPALDLTAADFEVSENGVERPVTRAALGNAPMRIALLVDSSTPVAQMLNHIRPALNAFLDALPPEHEVALITTGGQLRIRAQPTTDRARLKAEASRFASDGGANSFVDALLESERRLLRPVPNWPVFVILTTDNGETRGEPNIDRYNRFLDEFLLRGGTAHGVVVRGASTGIITEIAQNLVQNTGGSFDVINLATGLAPRFKALAERLATDHQKMATRYEVEYTSDAKLEESKVQVGVARPGVSVQVSPRRPF